MGTEYRNGRCVDVICQHRKDGSIIPLRIRLETSDGERQTFNVRSYREAPLPGVYTMPNGVSSMGHIKLYDCKIEVFGNERTIRLRYNTFDGIWNMAV